MTATAVILAGGKGTRAADPSRPKLAQTIGGRSLMEWHINVLSTSEITDVIVVAGHLGEEVQTLCDSVSHPSLKITVIHEAEQNGTVAALCLAAEHTESDEFLVILGDILMSFPVDAFLARWRQSGANAGVAVHPSTHPEDSDAAFPAHDGTVKVVPKSQPRSGIPNMSSAGLFAITRACLQIYCDGRDLGSHVLPLAAARNDLYTDVNSHYFKDTGTPGRLEAAVRDFASGAFARRGSTSPRRAIFLDRDGVVNPALPEVYKPEDFTLNPGVALAIREANLKGIPVFVATNQPGIAKGFMAFDTHEAIRAEMDRLLAADGAFVDDYAYCPHHPEAGFEGEVPELKVECTCRKPEPGLLRALAMIHDIDLSASVFVGDTARDAGAAVAAGAAFIDVSDEAALAPADGIRRAIEVVTC